MRAPAAIAATVLALDEAVAPVSRQLTIGHAAGGRTITRGQEK